MLSSGTMALRSACLLGSTGGWRGIIGVAVVELRGKKLGGEREAGQKRQSIAKGEVALSWSSSTWGEKEG